LVAGLSAPVLGCAGAGGSAKSPGESGGEGGATLQAKFEREAEAIQKHVVEAKGVFTAHIEAKAAPKVSREGGVLTVTADLGWESDVKCFVYDDVIDTGSAANLMLRAAGKEVQFKQLGAYFLDHQALDPIVAIRGLYHVERDGTVAAGDFKLTVMPRQELPVLCMHDAPGYAKSFARVTADFAKSFQFKSEQPAPMRGELWVVTLDGSPIGFSREATYKLEDGNVRKVTLGADFIPSAPGEIGFTDRAAIVTSDKDGKLSTGKFIDIENGESALSVDIERTKTGYNYAGTVQNKEVKGSFKPAEPLKSALVLSNKLKALAGKVKEVKFEQWEYVPSIDPSKASKVSYQISSTKEGMKVITGLGQRSFVMMADNRGVLNKAEMSVGSKKVQMNLMDATGEP
jgi:hypothetical protein